METSAILVTGLPDLSGLSDTDVADRLRVLELEDRKREAEIALLIAEAERRKLHRADAHFSTRNWLYAEHNWSPQQVVRRRRLAELIELCPLAYRALSAGYIGIAQAEELGALRANPRIGEQVADVIDSLLALCEDLPFVDARTRIKTWETLTDLDGSYRDRQNQVDKRTAFLTEIDGALFLQMSGGTSYDLAECRAVLEAYVEHEFHVDVAARAEQWGDAADKHPLPRTLGQRRYDAMRAIIRDAANNTGPTNLAVPVTVQILCDEHSVERALADHGLWPEPDPTTLPDEADDPIGLRCQTDDGTVLLPDDVVRAMIAGHIRRVVYSTDGIIVDAGRQKRLFTGAIRDIIKLSVAHCGHLGCTVGSRHAQVDHLHEWGRHGDTNAANGGVECGPHNRHKHKAGLRVKRNVIGTLNWYRRDGTEMIPTGRRHIPDQDDIEAAIRARIDALIASRRPA